MKSVRIFAKWIPFTLLSILLLAGAGCAKKVEIRGTVADMRDSAAIEGAQVRVLDADGKESATATTDETGGFSVKVPESGGGDPMVYTLSVSAQGYFAYPNAMQAAVPLNMADAQSEKAAKGLVFDAPSTTVKLIRQVLISGTLAAVTAAGASAAPLAGVSVQAYDVNGVAVGGPAVTDASGAYTLTLPECWDANGDGVFELGVYTIRPLTDQYQSISEGILEDARIDMGTAVEQPNGDGTSSLTIDGGAAGVVVAPTVLIRGQVMDFCQVPVAGAVVTALDGAGLPVGLPATTDAQGGCSLPVPRFWVTERGCTPAAPGKAACAYVDGVYTLAVEASGFDAYPTENNPASPLNTAAATVPPAGGSAVLQSADTSIVMVRVFLLQGVVTDYVDGAPIAGAQVSVVDADGETVSGPVATDAQGQYSVSIPQAWDADGSGQLARGAYALRVAAQGYWPYPSNLTPSEAFAAPDCAVAAGTTVPAEPVQLVREVLLRGRVVELGSDAPIAGALVQPLDINGTPVGSTAETDAQGMYALRVPQVWDLDGVLDDQSGVVYGDYLLRCQAMGYQEFPTAIRPSLPISMEAAVEEAPAAGELRGTLVIDGEISSLTTIKLISLGVDLSTLGSLSGHIASSRNAGVLVVAVNSVTGTAYTGFSGFEGNYSIFNVPQGSYRVEGYAHGVQIVPLAAVPLAMGQRRSGVDLAQSENALNSVSGNIQIVNAPGGALTSVVLAVESTFDAMAARGVVPPGLRVAGVSGSFVITDIPDGRYVVLAAFENDGLVRDPDTSIAGTQIVHLQVPGPGGVHDISIPDSFKVTEALAVASPGADGPEAIPTLAPVLQWADDSSEDGYEVRVLDSFGNQMWHTTVPGVSGSALVSLPYEGAALAPDMYYQFRVTSTRKGVNISSTEDLKGVFYCVP